MNVYFQFLEISDDTDVKIKTSPTADLLRLSRIDLMTGLRLNDNYTTFFVYYYLF